MTDHDTTPLYPRDGQPEGGANGYRSNGYGRMWPEETVASPGAPPLDRRPTVKLNAGRLWAGGVMTAVVVALMMIVGVSVARGIFAVPVPVPSSGGGLSSFAYVLLGVLAATALAHLLIMAAPRPLMFFGWIIFLCAVIAVLAPFQNSVFGSFNHIAMLNAKVATAVINLCAGIAIGSLITGVARSSVLVRRGNNPQPPVRGPLA
jgi:hypothetical protein